MDDMVHVELIEGEIKEEEIQDEGELQKLVTPSRKRKVGELDDDGYADDGEDDEEFSEEREDYVSDDDGSDAVQHQSSGGSKILAFAYFGLSIANVAISIATLCIVVLRF